jgi:2'-5' RNA ligase
VDTKSFRAHLTLGRISRRSRAFGAVLRSVMGEDRSEPTHWVVDHVTLYAIRLGAGSAAFHVVESVELSPSLNLVE